MNENFMKDSFEKLLSNSKNERKKLVKKDCVIVSSLEKPKVKDYLINFTNCCYNRMLDIFDDTIFLLDNNKIQSACTISRAMIETHAFLIFTIDKLNKLMQKKNVTREELIISLLESINSSRVKVDEQKRFKKGEFKLENYQFTEQAQNRIKNAEAINTNVMDALRNLYKQQIKAGTTSDIPTEASAEQVYNLLSEWVHPSQTSLFTNYVEETHIVSCRLGKINVFEHAKFLCAQALYYICYLEKNYNVILKLSNDLPD